MSQKLEQGQFPEGMTPLGSDPFAFDCHSKVSCFTVCCRKVDMILYPYDVIRLRAALGVDSETFMRQHTYLQKIDNPFFPSVKLKMLENGDCPFLGNEGCSVYHGRPSACRTYPLERAVSRHGGGIRPDEYFFITRHDYCLGHLEEKKQDVRAWVRSQGLHDYLLYNDLWAELDTLFATNPWQGEGAGGEKQQLAFMVCYNIDRFRSFVVENRLTSRFRLDKEKRRGIEKDDMELLKFGFEWLKYVLGASSGLTLK